MPEGGDSNSNVISAIIGFLAGLFGFGKDAVGALASAVTKLGSWTANAVRSIRDVLSVITGKGIWDGIKRVARALDALRKRLAGWIAPLLEWLKKARDWLDWIYHRVIRPLINLIQRLRMFLVVLRQLHVKWAEKLDKILVRVEADIYKTFGAVRAAVNDIITILEEIQEPGGLFRAGIVLLSAAKYATEIQRILSALGLHALDSADTKRLDYYSHYATSSGQAALIKLHMQGFATEEDTRVREQFEAELKRLANG
jgi:hypothetical protein